MHVPSRVCTGQMVLSFYPAEPGYRTQVIKLSSKPPLSQLEGHFFNSIWNATCWERPTSTTLFEYFLFSLPLLSLCECYPSHCSVSSPAHKLHENACLPFQQSIPSM